MLTLEVNWNVYDKIVARQNDSLEQAVFVEHLVRAYERLRVEHNQLKHDYNKIAFQKVFYDVDESTLYRD